MTNEIFLQQTYEARDRYIANLGQVSPDVLAPPINPAFFGGPEWPNLRQAWRVVRRSGPSGVSSLFMSDGLSDPFADREEKNVGLGLEVLVESADELPEPISTSWLFDVVEQVSQQCAHHGGIREIIDRNGLISLELPLTEPLQAVATDHGTAGVLLGVASADFAGEFELPGGLVKAVTAKLLWPSELAYAVAQRKAGREELARRFAADGTHHRSSLLRKPVV